MDFKQYVLGTLFYRFLSDNFSNYMEGGDASVHYADLDDNIITADIIDDAVKTKGYFIYPSHLFCRVAKEANTNESLNTDLKAMFVFPVTLEFNFFKRRADLSFHLIEQGSTESITEKRVIKMFHVAPETVIAVTAFRNETMDMGIPFKIPAKSVQNHDKTGSKI